MMMSGSSTGRKELLHELRETSLIGGNAVQRRGMVDRGVQFIGNMDLGSGDTSDYVFGNRNNYDSFNEVFQYNSHLHSPIETPTIRLNVTGPSLTPPRPPQPPSTPPIGNLNYSSSSESVDVSPFGHDKSDSDHFFKGKEANRSTEKDYTSVVVEEGKQPNFRANESNPTVPTPKEPSKTSTLRLSDRPRSARWDATTSTCIVQQLSVRRQILPKILKKEAVRVFRQFRLGDTKQTDQSESLGDLPTGPLEVETFKINASFISPVLSCYVRHTGVGAMDRASIKMARAIFFKPLLAESEDDIEKVDDPEQDGAIFDHKALYKTKVMTEDSQNSEKMDKNGNRSDGEQNEVDNDCIVQCLYYTIQCCECVTF
ncbi:hypothetical protein RUM44_010170 [Polyplax serrata]|uniref:Uncharacterized protein n=1 Tax=Polyplax serrata TaxID=468196 RepID=A0ABR1AUT7_POLSC